MKDLVDYADSGALTAEWDDSAPKYNARQLSDYCKKHNKRPNELTEELKMLQTNK